MNKSYSEALESYLIAEEADTNTNAPNSKEKLKTICKGIAAAAIMALGAKAIYDDNKRTKEIAKINKENIAKAKAEQEEHENWKKFSPEYTEYCKYVSKKYHVNYPDLSDSDKKALANKLDDSIEADLKKIANGINRNKKLCNELAEKYLKYARRDDPEYFETLQKSYEDDAEEIRRGPACGYSENGDGDFCISDIDQTPRSWVCDEYLFDSFSDAINKKYYREIKLGIMTKMKWIGDGDEGLIGCNYKD